LSDEGSLEKLKEAILTGDGETAAKAAEEVVEAGMDPLEVIEKHLSPTMKMVGEKFEKGEFFLTHLMLSAEAMKSATSLLSSKISEERMKAKMAGKVVIGTVAGDIHDIGKNIVTLLLEIAGFDVRDLGVDVESMKFVEEADKFKADVIALSALMSNTRTLQREAIELLKGLGKRDKHLIIVGGGATTKEWAEEIGADGWAETAVEAPKLAAKLIRERKVHQ